MCETFFGLKRRPFLFAPDVESYFSVNYMEESRQTIEAAVQNGEGISLIFGASGTGKTLLMHILHQSLKSEHTAVLVSHSRLETPRDLFLQLFHDLHLSRSGEETVGMRLQLLDFARQEPHREIVLLFDEAQYLHPSVLEEIRLLTDSSDGSAPCFRAVLAGTTDFEETLTLPNLEVFNQRVVSRCYLDSFTGDETSRYIVRQTDRLRIDPPHQKSSPLFTEEAKRRIHQLTDGVPRLINQLCGAALQCAADREVESVDGSLVNDAWASLQHIASDCEIEQEKITASQESVISPEQVEEIVDQKKKTFQFRQFNSVEFGILTDVEAVETEVLSTYKSFHEKEYKPPYPEDDDEFAEQEESEPEVYRLPSVAAKLLEPPAKNFVPQRKSVSENFDRQHHKFRRRYLLQKIRHRLGFFAGVLRKADPRIHESDMNEESLQKYGAAVLEGRPPFVRKEPHYAYQTPEPAPKSGLTYPDPKTGEPIMLRWFPEKTEENGRFGVSYTEFLNQASAPKPLTAETGLVKPSSESEIESVFRTSLKASLDEQAAPPCCSGLEESFEESQHVCGTAISLAELFQADSSALQRIEESGEFKNLDAAIQRQLEGLIRRITKAAEKIEQAAEVSERAGQHVSRAAEFVETEVKSALPSYTDLFRQWSEFQDMISAELESARQRHSDPPQFRTFPRRPVMIERTIPSIDVESLFR